MQCQVIGIASLIQASRLYHDKSWSPASSAVHCLATTHDPIELCKRESYMFINLTGVYYDKSQSNSYHCSIFRHLLSYLALNQHSLSVIKQLAVVPSVSSCSLRNCSPYLIFHRKIYISCYLTS